MRYTVMLTKRQGNDIHAVIPGLPGCSVRAETKSEALQKIRETLRDLVSRSEIVQIEVPAEIESDNSDKTPWKFFGAFKDDPGWGHIFDEIENHRNISIKGDV